VTLVPGNHDAYARATVGHAPQIWGPYMRAEDAESAFPFVRRRGPVALIGLSSAVPTAPFMATGHLGRAQLSRFSELLAELGKEGLFRVVLIHHPPVSVPSKRFKRLLDGKRFRQALAEHGAELVLHGHDHVHAVVPLNGPNGPVPAVGVPSASAAPDGSDQPAAYNLYQIEGKPGAWRCIMTRRGFERGGTNVAELGRQALRG
jgi:3',5'-cyclic AMP phosphodiesterase CpdA